MSHRSLNNSSYERYSHMQYDGIPLYVNQLICLYPICIIVLIFNFKKIFQYLRLRRQSNMTAQVMDFVSAG